MSEASCHIVSSRGILKACCFHNPRPLGNSMSRCLEIHPIFRYNNIKMPRTPTVHFCSSALSYFIESVLPTITIPFVLVTGDSDCSIPDRPLEELNPILNNPLLRHWYSQNMIIEHPKMTCMPIGLDYHTVTESVYSGKFYRKTAQIELMFQRDLKKETAHGQEKVLKQILSGAKHFSNRIPLCFVNFGSEYPDRVDAHASIDPRLVAKYPLGTKRDKIWEEQSRYSFVVSPLGNGIDCHRTWEALALGCIVIVKKPLISAVFEDLPVLIVDEWRDLNAQLLNETLADFSNRKFKMGKLTLQYWMTKMHSH